MLGTEGISPAATVSPPLAAQPSATVRGAADARLKDTAKELEATFLGMLLKEMRQSEEPDGGLFPGDTGDVLGGLFDLHLGQYLAAAGGIGLADSLVRQMHATDPKPAPTTNAPAIAPTRGYAPSKPRA
jgi:flagellar protein FlgJ